MGKHMLYTAIFNIGTNVELPAAAVAWEPPASSSQEPVLVDWSEMVREMKKNHSVPGERGDRFTVKTCKNYSTLS